jgi:uncharacterized protein
VKVIDLNLLLYAVNRDSAQHASAKAWLEATLSNAERVALPWPVILGFLRLSTDSRILPRPLRAEQARRVVDAWLELPNVVALNPGEDHWTTLRALLEASGTGGNLTTDAHLAAIAIEHDAELCSTDHDFGRFSRLRWLNPLGLAKGRRRRR